MNWPKVTVFIVTYDRPREIRLTIDALKKHLKYKGELLWHLSDDGTERPYLFEIKRDYPDLKFSSTVTERKGFGANCNKGMTNCWARSDYLFFCEDDRVVTRDMDLSSGVAVLESNKNIGLIRYDGVAGHALDLQLREIETDIGKVQCMVISHTSPHLNYYSNQPHLLHRRFHDKYGLYPEGMSLGRTEEAFAHRVKNKYLKGSKIAILQDGIENHWQHIGVSRQLTKHDIGKQ